MQIIKNRACRAEVLAERRPYVRHLYNLCSLNGPEGSAARNLLQLSKIDQQHQGKDSELYKEIRGLLVQQLKNKRTD